jgi:hypothetical protein
VRLRIEESVRVLTELLEAALVAEVVGLPLVFDMTNRIVRCDGHSTHRIDDFGWRDRVFVHAALPDP